MAPLTVRDNLHCSQTVTKDHLQSLEFFQTAFGFPLKTKQKILGSEMPLGWFLVVFGLRMKRKELKYY